MTLLAVDIGNSTVSLGLFRGSGRSARLLGSWRLATDTECTPDKYGEQIRSLIEKLRNRTPDKVAAAISSVVPVLTHTLATACAELLNTQPYVVRSAAHLGTAIHYTPAADLGTDRLCNAIAAFELYGGPAIAIDFGTATTFDAIDESGAFLGGAISPGFLTSSEALIARTAQLAPAGLTPPDHAIGATTADAIRSGTLLAYGGMVQWMISRFRSEIRADAQVIATGGLARVIKPVCPDIDTIDDALTLQGVRILFERDTGAD